MVTARNQNQYLYSKVGQAGMYAVSHHSLEFTHIQSRCLSAPEPRLPDVDDVGRQDRNHKRCVER